MKKIAVLGSTGMIGSGLIAAMAESNFDIIEFNRAGKSTTPGTISRKIDVLTDDWQKELQLSEPFDYVINAIGLIRHKIDTQNPESLQDAIRVNSLFPLQLDQFSTEVGFKVIQIGTDCVFSGSKGSYDENSTFDPYDVYGRTKVLGESLLTNTFTLRVSVVGKELSTSTELMSWVLNQPHKAILQGFENHIWNGVTPLQLAKVLTFVMESKITHTNTHHLVPGDKISKYQLLRMIADIGGREDIKVEPFSTAHTVDRSLSTSHSKQNEMLWLGAGYEKAPLIGDMIREYETWANF